MTTYYMNADTGNNGNDGSSGSPWLTLTFAIDNSTTDDTIIFQDSTATYLWETDIIQDRTLEAENTGEATLDGAGAQIKWTINGIVSITGLHFTDAVGVTGALNPIFELDRNADMSLTILNCLFTDIAVSNTNSTGGLFSSEGNNINAQVLTVTSCIFVDITRVSAIINSYSSIFGGRNDTNGTLALTVTNSTFYFVTSDANTILNQISTWSGSARYTVVWKNNIFANFSGVALKWISTGGGAGAPDDETLSYQDSYLITSVPAASNSITTDPLFVDAGNSDFRLRQGSPAIDAGVLV